MKSQFYTVLACAALGYGVPAHANLIITPTFNSSITSDPNASAIEATINQAISAYESEFTNNVTVDIYFQEGGGLGTSNFTLDSVSYKQFYDDLVSNNANRAAIAGLTNNGGDGDTNGGVNPVTDTSTIVMKTANARALGISTALPGCHLISGPANGEPTLPEICGGSTGPAYDGIISLNTSLTFGPQADNGSNYSLLSVVEHETDEMLGLGSALENCNGCTSGLYDTLNNGLDSPEPEDLFRYNAVLGGTRTLSTNCSSPTAAYFAYGPSTAAIEQFDNSCDGADFGDWASNGTAQVQDAFGTPAATPTLGAGEIEALTAIGYIQAVPEPTLFFPVACMLGLLFRQVRRRAQ